MSESISELRAIAAAGRAAVGALRRKEWSRAENRLKALRSAAAALNAAGACRAEADTVDDEALRLEHDVSVPDLRPNVTNGRIGEFEALVEDLEKAIERVEEEAARR